MFGFGVDDDASWVFLVPEDWSGGDTGVSDESGDSLVLVKFDCPVGVEGLHCGSIFGLFICEDEFSECVDTLA